MKKNKLKEITKAIWWSVVITGIASIVFGLVAIIWPGMTLATLVTLFTIFVIVMGAVWLMESLASVKSDPLWWLGLLFSALAIALGVYAFMNPELTVAVFVILLALFVFAQSLIDFINASYAPKGEKWPWVVTGLLGIVFGITVIGHPKSASLAFVWVLGVYLIARGALSIVYAGRAKMLAKRLISGGAKKKAKKAKK